MEAEACLVGGTGTGTCYLHGAPVSYTTTFIEGSDSLNNKDLQVVLVGHTGEASCGHMTIATTGSDMTDVNGVKIHRVGDIGHIIGDPASTYVAQPYIGNLNVK